MSSHERRSLAPSLVIGADANAATPIVDGCRSRDFFTEALPAVEAHIFCVRFGDTHLTSLVAVDTVCIASRQLADKLDVSELVLGRRGTGCTVGRGAAWQCGVR
jgi:hypothetical protein